MRITIDTEAQDAVPVVSSTANETSLSAPTAGGSAPAALQAASDTLNPVAETSDVDAGPPSAELMAAILAASPAFSNTQAIDGGAGPR